MYNTIVIEPKIESINHRAGKFAQFPMDETLSYVILFAKQLSIICRIIEVIVPQLFK